MKNIKLLLILLLTNKAFAQVGINTNNPQATLDINGTFNIRKELRLKGTDTQKGQAGATNQLLSVKESGTDVVDEWKSIKLANGTGSLSLYYLNTTIDKEGIEFSTSGSTNSYAENAPFTTSTGTTTANWVRIKNNNDDFTITDVTKKSKAVLSFQTTVQITPFNGNGNGNSASFACGIFVKKDDGTEQLKAVRSDVLRGAAGSYKVYNLNVTLDGLEQGYYKVSAACSNRNLGSGTAVVTLGIGKPVNATYLNSAMTQSSLSTTVLQPF
ncbi:hypothetical protein [Chryseobacterium sp. T1]